MSFPLLSVIVPVYNTAPWLRRCLDSICAQSYRNLEILCVNDGSTDNSAEVLAEYAAKDARIKVFTQANAGLSAARNTALAHATGEWVTGVDSDDYLYPGVYEQAVGCITDEVDMVFFGVQNVTEDGTPLPHDGYFDLPEAGRYEMTPELAEKLNVCFWSKLWRGDLIKRYELHFPDGLLYEDNAFYCCAIPFVNKVAFYQRIGYMYTQRATSIMGKKVDTQTQVTRNSAIYHYVAKHYKRVGLKPETSPYFAIMFHASYTGLTSIVETNEQECLRSGFWTLSRKLNMKNEQWDDYRLHRLKPVHFLMRPFIQKHHNSVVVNFSRLKLISFHYDNLGRYRSMRILPELCRALRQEIRTILQRLIRN